MSTEREIGGIIIGRPLRVGGTRAGGPVTVPGTPSGGRLAELVDVELTDGPEPTVLVRDPETGIFHSRPLSQVSVESRGDTIWYVEQPPPQVLPDEWKPGDWVAVIAGDQRGDVYRITEE